MRKTALALTTMLLVGLLATPAAAGGWNPPIEYVTTFSPIACTDEAVEAYEVHLWRQNDYQDMWKGGVSKVTFTYREGSAIDGEVVFEETLVRTPGRRAAATDWREVCALAGY